MAGKPTPRQSSRAGNGPLGDLGLAVAHRRREMGLTQRDLALLVDVGERSVQSVEAGKLSIRTDVLMKVLDGLGLALVAMRKSDARHQDAATTVVLRRRDGR